MKLPTPRKSRSGWGDSAFSDTWIPGRRERVAALGPRVAGALLLTPWQSLPRQPQGLWEGLLLRRTPLGRNFPPAPAQSAAATPHRAGPGDAPGVFKSLVPDLQVRACARRGGGNLRPLMQTRSALSGAGLPGPLSAHRPLRPLTPGGRPLASHFASNHPPHPVPAASRRPKGAPTSHEASGLPPSPPTRPRAPARVILFSHCFPCVIPEVETPLGSLEQGAAPLPGSRRHTLYIPPGVLHLTYPLSSAPFQVFPHLQNCLL